MAATDVEPSIPNQTTRLHITPFNPTLLNVIVPPSILPSAKNISYHSLQTFPEKSYGFVELPKVDAEKIKKKLNGSILKGSKVRIEEARPSRERTWDMDVDDIVPKERKEKVEKGSRKRKRHDEVLPGVELRDRKVQRGWTTPATETKKSDKRHKDKKGKKVLVKSKFTTHPECLFKTSLPPNVASNLKEDTSLSTLGGKLRRKKSSKSDKELVVVHEFSKTTKHATFLRGSGVATGSKAVSSYVEGKGWVDKDGNVVEAEVPKRGRPTVIVSNAAVGADAESRITVSSSSEEEDSSEDEKDEGQDLTKTSAPVSREASDTSSSGSSSEEDEEDIDVQSKDRGEINDEEDSTSSSDSDSESSSPASKTSQPSEQQSRPGTATSIPPSLSLQIPNTETTPVKVHPLEALYKKGKADSKATTATPSFSFFNNDDDNEDIDNSRPHLSIPMTPFTQQEFEFRGLRSAAPTPDTAHPGKTYAVWPNPPTSSSNKFNIAKFGTVSNEDDEDADEDEDEDEDEEEEEYTKSPSRTGSSSKPTKAKAAGESGAAAPAPASDFEKWFYEHRGEANRAWKKRRKIASKEKRHRENKKRGGGRD